MLGQCSLSSRCLLITPLYPISHLTFFQQQSCFSQTPALLKNYLVSALSMHVTQYYSPYQKLMPPTNYHRQTLLSNYSPMKQANARQKYRMLSLASYVTMDSNQLLCLHAIIAEDKTAESLCKSIAQTFKESKELLETWRTVTVELFPNQLDLVNLIPRASDLTMSKIEKQGIIMTDTCSTACKFLQLLIDDIKNLAVQEGWSADMADIFEGSC